MKMSEEKKIIEEDHNENNTHTPIEESKQKPKDTKTQAKKNNKEAKKQAVVTKMPEIVEVKEVIKKSDVIPQMSKNDDQEEWNVVGSKAKKV